MKEKTEVYQTESELDTNELDFSNAGLEVSKVDEKSLEIISQFLSFLYQVDKEILKSE